LISDDDFAVDLDGELVIIWERFMHEQRSFNALASDVTYILYHVLRAAIFNRHIKNLINTFIRIDIGLL
jgi:hypothetical protein